MIFRHWWERKKKLLKKLNAHLRSKINVEITASLACFFPLRFSPRWWNYSRSSFPTIDVTFASWDQGGKSPIFQSKPLVYLFCCSGSTQIGFVFQWLRGFWGLDPNSWESFAKIEDAIWVSSLHSSIIFLTRSIFSNRCAYQRELYGMENKAQKAIVNA